MAKASEYPQADLLELECAEGADLAEMMQGHHYDYVAQRWVDGHDHAHFLTQDGPLYFCGADLATCDADGQGTARFVAAQ